MNLYSAFEELDKLYESIEKAVQEQADEEIDEGVIGNIAGATIGATLGRAVGNALTEEENEDAEVEEGFIGSAASALVGSAVGTAIGNKLTEDDEIIIEDDVDSVEELSTTEDTATEDVEVDPQFILECSRCGGLCIKPEAKVNINEESGIANAEEVCQYCEAVDGYKVLGTLVPYDTEESEEAVAEVEEAPAE